MNKALKAWKDIFYENDVNILKIWAWDILNFYVESTLFLNKKHYIQGGHPKIWWNSSTFKYTFQYNFIFPVQSNFEIPVHSSTFQNQKVAIPVHSRTTVDSWITVFLIEGKTVWPELGWGSWNWGWGLRLLLLLRTEESNNLIGGTNRQLVQQ